jgi:cytochrome c6
MNKTNLSTQTLRQSLLSACLVALSMSSFSAFAGDPVNGQRVYQANCAGCHGPNGLSVMPNAPNLARGERINKADQVLVDGLRSGVGTMPPFFGVVKDADLHDVISYVRTLH